ncbi:MAG: aldehyde ferredoxin oxidoreductase N-terminal domain-containing protein [Chloroflexota bacterium]
MPYGNHEKILPVHLNTGEIQIEFQDESFYRKYMDGSALGVYYLLKHTPASTDPLSPENTLVLALSLLTGAPISGQSRITAVAKSPLTGGKSDGNLSHPEELEDAKNIYYQLAGWNEQVNPTKETLGSLGLEWLTD